jgi:UDP-glucose 4-epimerase
MKDTHALAGLYKSVNTDATLNLARQAASADVKRFIFLSSIKVNGEATEQGAPFSAISTPAPVDPYGVSKLEAERGLFALAHSTGMEVVVVRPVLVYGPNVKGNFERMVNWVERGIPLPLGAIRNLRSMVGIDNLVDFLTAIISHPSAKNQVFLVSDGEDLSTTSLLRKTARALGKSARLIPVPQSLLVAAARLLGKSDVALRLCGSLQVDITKARTVLGWSPRYTVDEQLERYARSRAARG